MLKTYCHLLSIILTLLVLTGCHNQSISKIPLSALNENNAANVIDNQSEEQQSKIHNNNADSKYVEYTQDNWHFKKDQEDCYVYSFPISSSGFYIDRSLNYLLINNKQDIILISGLYYKDDYIAEMMISKNKFNMLTEDNKAWIYENNELLIHKLLENTEIPLFIYSQFQQISGENNENDYAIDKYSLKGFKEVWQTMEQLCEIHTNQHNTTIS